MDAAHGVCGEDGADQHDTLDLLTGLVDESMVIMRSVDGVTRYGVLETLRAYGRGACATTVLKTSMHAATPHILRNSPNARQACMAPMNRHGSNGCCPTDNLRTAYEHAMTAGDVDLALALITSLSEFVHLRIGFEASGWAERALEVVDPEHPLFAATVGFAARGAWNRGDRVRGLASLAEWSSARPWERPGGVSGRRAGRCGALRR